MNDISERLSVDPRQLAHMCTMTNHCGKAMRASVDDSPLWFVLGEDLALGVVPDILNMGEAAKVELFRTELRHGEYVMCND